MIDYDDEASFYDTMQEVYGAESYADIDDDQQEELIKVIENPKFYIEHILKIQDKRNNLVPLIFNQAQQKLYAEYQRQKSLGMPIRIIILKARQMGFSTAVSALFYQSSATHENMNSAIIAHKNEASTNILEKMKLFYEESPEVFKPLRRACNAKMILFENPTNNENLRKLEPGLRSKIIIESAVNKNALRSATVHNLHLSELAFWPYPEETMTSALQAVPHEKDTAVIIESTANGVGGVFYDEWVRAVEGNSEFTPLFFAWFDHGEYRMPVPPDFELTEEEAALKEKYDLSDEQLSWRRWCISANCGGDIEKFHQEYPSEWHEAFLASGRPVFDINALDLAIRQAPKPKKIGRVIQDEHEIRFRSEYKGYLSIWEEPKRNIPYVIGADPSSGDRDGDPAAMSVFRKDTLQQVAEWWGYMPPDLLGKEAVILAKYYNDAFLIPEANNHGVSFIDSVKRMHYRNIFRRRTSPEARKEGNTDKYGWWTSEQSKKLLINTFAKFIRENATKIKSKKALNECVTYVRDDKDRTNAQQGCHDDLVMANALAVYGSVVRPYSNKIFKEKSPVELYKITSSTGY